MEEELTYHFILKIQMKIMNSHIYNIFNLKMSGNYVIILSLSNVILYACAFKNYNVVPDDLYNWGKF